MFDLLFAGSLGGFYGVSMCARVRARVCVCPLCACLWVGGCSILGCLYGTGSLHAYVARLRSLGSKPLCGGFAERILQWKWLGWVKIKAGCSPPPPGKHLQNLKMLHEGSSLRLELPPEPIPAGQGQAGPGACLTCTW